ncbi:hypothetical protein INT44_001443 [Umbelopsis vinacea]|uniref:Alkaline ceramidase 3 n=1 Tax=Umbelopsis vinacea TaxID=44442 RepID=A0A8H7PQF8_9FUNG|nr:hypothetical protein INT44_001443 [Umbelopsis vinacea]
MSTLSPDSPFWGPVTSTIDWCEENYVVSRYIAEFFNTTTNLVFVFLSLYGIRNTYQNDMPGRFILAYFAIMFIGFGSWCFHMTLQYEMQLLDELPMIYGASILTWHIFEIYPENRYGIWLPLALIGYSVFVTWSYLIIKNPVFHQVSYAILVFTVVFRSTSLVKRLPKDSPERPQLAFLLKLAASGFLGAFLVWNVDNQFCDQLRAWRGTVNVAVGSISQLHGFWHIMTGLGVYFYVVYNEYIYQIFTGRGDQFKLIWVAGVIPRLIKVQKKD